MWIIEGNIHDEYINVGNCGIEITDEELDRWWWDYFSFKENHYKHYKQGVSLKPFCLWVKEQLELKRK